MVLLSLKKLCSPGKQALVCFLLSSSGLAMSFFLSGIGWTLLYWSPALYYCSYNIFRYCYRDFNYEVSIRAAFLGSAFGTGLFLTTLDGGLKVFGLYAMLLSFFHFSEFMSVALTNPDTLTVESYIINQSMQNGIGPFLTMTEWAVEYYFFPGMKTWYWVSAVGVVMCVGGEVIRKAAMFTAKDSFNVQFKKTPDHQLVTHGVYSICRHPTYAGWFYWSIGTQIILLNPVCVAIYLDATWTHNKERVYAEEALLLAFYKKQYIQYQKSVPTGLPFVRGYVLDPPARIRLIKVDDYTFVIEG